MLQTLADTLLALLWLSMFLTIPCRQGLKMYANSTMVVYGFTLTVISGIIAYGVRESAELNTPGFMVILAPLLLFFSGIGRIRKPYLLLWILFWIAGVLLTGIIGFAFYAKEAGNSPFTQGIIFLTLGISALFVILQTNFQYQKIDNKPASSLQVFLPYLVLIVFMVIERASGFYIIFSFIALSVVLGILRVKQQLQAHYPAVVTTILLAPGFLMQSEPLPAIFISLLSLVAVFSIINRLHHSYFDPAWIVFIATAISGYIASLIYIIQVLQFNQWILLVVLHAQIFAALIFNFIVMALFQFATEIREKPVQG